MIGLSTEGDSKPLKSKGKCWDEVEVANWREEEAHEELGQTEV